MSQERKVAVALVCMDKRLHTPEAELVPQLQKLLNVDDVYVLTTAGPAGRMLAAGHHAQALSEDTQLIIDAKGASVVALCEHYDCAGHPVSDDQHDQDAARAAEHFKQQINFAGDVVPLVAKPGNETTASWQIVQL